MPFWRSKIKSKTGYCKNSPSNEVGEAPMEEEKQTRPNGCPKCGCREVRTDRIAVTGSGLSRFFDVQNREFLVVSCVGCGYSEFYRKTSSTLAEVVDFFFGK